MEFVIITGMSGSGKSAAINALEDIGFFCVDNMPPQLIPIFSKIGDSFGEGLKDFELIKEPIKKAAFVTDIRGGEMFLGLAGIIDQLKKSGVNVKVIFLNAADEVIKRRYKETRRLHPLFATTDGNVVQAIAKEREFLVPIAEIADYTIDTGMLSTSALKEAVLDIFLDKASDSMLVKCISFGFKYGAPGDADLVFDVRFLPNPFYVPELKEKTGTAQEVRDFVMKSEIAQELECKLLDLLGFLIPRYVAEGKSQLVIAFGCTGGKHRSVTFAERLYEDLKGANYKVKVFHRDLKNYQ